MRDAGRTPLFQVSFAWEQTRRFSEGPGPENGGLRLETVHVGQGGAPFDLMMEMAEHDGKLSGVLQYNTDLFDATTIERMAGHYATLLGGIVADPGRRVSQLPLLTEEERRQQAAWNETEVTYDAPALLHEMVATTVARVPDAVAVTCGDRELTYAELDRRANDLAHRLGTSAWAPRPSCPSCWTAPRIWWWRCSASSRRVAPSCRWTRRSPRTASP